MNEKNIFVCAITLSGCLETSHAAAANLWNTKIASHIHTNLFRNWTQEKTWINHVQEHWKDLTCFVRWIFVVDCFVFLIETNNNHKVTWNKIYVNIPWIKGVTHDILCSTNRISGCYSWRWWLYNLSTRSVNSYYTDSSLTSFSWEKRDKNRGPKLTAGIVAQIIV